MKKIIAASLLVGFSVVLFAAVYSGSVQDGISSKILRLHVIANSNSGADQELKLKVRDRILKEGRQIFQNTTSPEESRRILNKNIKNLTVAAEDEIEKNGFSYNVKIRAGNYFFPMKSYGGFTLPAGEYDAVRVEIGEGAGENWWCVMFPPLCFVDAAVDEGIAKILSEEEMAIISNSDNINIKFKIVDFFQNSIHTVKTAFKK